MTRAYIPIQRTFSEVPKNNQEQESEDFFHFLNRHKTTWEDIIGLHRVVILAEAGAGKTEEMLQTAKKLHSDGKYSFFIRIEDINSDFAESFEGDGAEEEFNEWLESENEAWFFLDSVDEAKLDRPQAFNKALRKFSKGINTAQSRSHIFISSRPYAWLPKTDTESVDSILPFNQVDPDNSKNVTIATQLYILNPLCDKDIQTFANERKVENIDELMAEITSLNMQSLASRPFDLDLVIKKFKNDGKLDSRLKMLEHTIKQMLNESHNPNRSLELLDVQKAKKGAKVLAATVTLVNESGINVPDSTLDKKGFASEEVLTAWKSTEIKELINTGLFNDILYGTVRFRHKEIRDYLSAKWFYSFLKQDGNLRAIEDLFFARMYGEEVIRPRLRQVLSWLILFDERLRKRALSIAPEIAVEGGDVSSLALGERKQILRKIVKRIVLEEDTNRSARDNSAIARIAQLDLQDCVLELVKQYQGNDSAIFFLGRLAWMMRTGYCNDEFSKIAVDTSRDIYARSVSIRSIMSSSDNEQKYSLWKQVNLLPKKLPRTLLVEIIADSPATQESVDLLLASLSILEPYKRYQYSGLRSEFSKFINKLKIDKHLLLKLVSGLYALLKSSPYIQKRDCKVSKQYYWLIPLSLEIIEHLVINKSKYSFAPEVISTLILTPKLKSWGGAEIDLKEYKGDLHTLIPKWKELNDHLFWETVSDERQLLNTKSETLDQYRQVQQFNRELFQFSEEDFDRVLDFITSKTFLDDRMVALSLAFDIYDRACRPSEKLTLLEAFANKTDQSLSDELRKLESNQPICEHWAKWKEEQLKTQEDQKKQQLAKEIRKQQRVEDIKNDPTVVLKKSDDYPETLINAQSWMLDIIRTDMKGSMASAAHNFEHLTEVCGIAAADNFKEFAKAHWRLYQPILGTEGDGYNQWTTSKEIGALGLEFEVLDNPEFTNSLSEDDLNKALHYITSELNGLPTWLEPLFQSHPKFVVDFIFNEIKWELESTPDSQTKYYLLSKLYEHAGWMLQALAPHLLNWLYHSEPDNYDNIKKCVDIIFSEISSKEKIANLAIRKASNPRITFASFWFAVLISANNHIGYHKLKTKLENLESGAREFAEDFAIKLIGDSYRGGLSSFRTVKNPKILADLYVLMNQYIKVGEDEVHTSGESYKPSHRDHAQKARSRLFTLLINLPGKETYFEILSLVERLSVKNSKSWLINNATSLAEQDSELDLWTTEQISEFAFSRLKTPSSHRELFELGLRQLLELKDWLETGNDSLAETYQKAKDETETRKIIAYHLRQKSLHKYTCNEEQPLANEQRPDIWLEQPRGYSPVPIEIKQLDKQWSGNKLCERLRNQLAGDYLREATAVCGIFLLVWNGKSKRKSWKINNDYIKLGGLQKALQDYWQSISPEYPNIESIEVIVIDLTTRMSVSRN